MNQSFKEKFLTVGRVKKSVFVNSKSEEKEEKIMFLYGYWVDIIEFKGEKKERFKFLKEENGVRQFYEEVFSSYFLVKKYVRFLDIGLLKKGKGKGGSLSGFMNENIVKFIGLERKEGASKKVDDFINDVGEFDKKELKSENDSVTESIKRVNQKSKDCCDSDAVNKRFSGRKVVPVLTSFGSIKKQVKRFAKKKKMI
jgi:hypothetical protein